MQEFNCYKMLTISNSIEDCQYKILQNIERIEPTYLQL